MGSGNRVISLSAAAMGRPAVATLTSLAAGFAHGFRASGNGTGPCGDRNAILQIDLRAY
ncbi:hypothetical protein SAMN05421505_1352 [Sinosporangium album]|uniref:Uncharacterized protein n=1 Tax=Sinosporangium album TaxID=504805 RepID=A0A1G8I2I3_9ACTN|nr:hypothetical protein SAMN05421505_1352 [Sinosporangium album]